MKKILAFFLLVVILLFLCACSNEQWQKNAETVVRTTPDNLILPSDTVFGGKVDCSNGELRAIDGFIASPVYYIISGEDYFFSVHNPTGGAVYGVEISGAYYDEQYRYISPIDMRSGVRTGGTWANGVLRLTRPESCRYVRFSVGGSDALLWKLQSASTVSQSKDDESLVIVNLGDSIFGGVTVYDETSISRQLSALTGSLVYNIGFGGGRMAEDDSCWSICSLSSLVTGIASDDYTALSTAIYKGWDGMPAYFLNTIQVLSNELDFSSVDIITISYGTNDYYEALPLENPSNPTDRKTVCGALRYSVNELQMAYPDIKIIVTTPIYRFFINEYNVNEFIYDGDRQNWGGGTLNDYANGIKETCEDLGVTCIDLKNDSPLKRDTIDEYFNTNDGAHPKAEGRQAIALLLAAEILSYAK